MEKIPQSGDICCFPGNLHLGSVCLAGPVEAVRWCAVQPSVCPATGVDSDPVGGSSARLPYCRVTVSPVGL